MSTRSFKFTRPEPWVPDVSRIDPFWRNAFKHAVFLQPSWPYVVRENSGQTKSSPILQDLITLEPAHQGSGHLKDWGRGSHGIAINNEQDINKIAEYTHNALWDLDGDVEFTILIALDFVSNTGNGGGFISHRTDSSTGAGYWAWSEGGGTDTAMKFEFQHSSGITSQQWASTFPAVGYNAWMLTRKAGGTFEMWVNGVSAGTKSGATQDLLGGSHELNIMAAGSQQFVGNFYMAAILKDITLETIHAEQFYRDPFGLVRPQIAPYPFPWQREGFAGPAGGLITSLAGAGGLAGMGGLAGRGGGIAG